VSSHAQPEAHQIPRNYLRSPSIPEGIGSRFCERVADYKARVECVPAADIPEAIAAALTAMDAKRVAVALHVSSDDEAAPEILITRSCRPRCRSERSDRLEVPEPDHVVADAGLQRVRVGHHVVGGADAVLRDRSDLVGAGRYG
jgi:hypothetical protein